MAYYHAPIWLCVYLMLVIVTVAEDLDRCNRRKCTGPIAHYLTLNCEPVYVEGQCCPVSYNCDNLYKRYQNLNLPNRCYLNGHEYEIGEKIREEDKNLCAENCICVNTKDDIADFNCNCQEARPSNTLEGHNYCYQRVSREQCYPETVCAESPETLGEKIPFCPWNGNAYIDNEFIMPIHKPKKLCVCEKRNTGSDMIMCAPFSQWSNVHAAYYFYKRCAPVYLENKQGIIGIHTQAWRCQDVNDSVFDIHYPDPERSKGVLKPLLTTYCKPANCGWFTCDPSEPCITINPEGLYGTMYEPTYKTLCVLGQLTMHVGDTLKNLRYENNTCITCTCEVPPVPTCILRTESCEFNDRLQLELMRGGIRK